MRFLVICFFIFLRFSVFAQTYEQALVTDLNFLRRSSETMYSENFPFYFQYKEFARDIQIEISELIKERFGVSEVLFLNPDSIYYTDLSIAPKIEAKDYAVVTKREKTLFIAIETILQENSVVNNEQIYRFTTRINVYNNKGKNIYKFKNHIPFVSVYGDEIAGKANMSEQDFYAFYFDGLHLAFEGKYKTITKRYISKPTSSEYSEFINNSVKFYLQTENSGYTYGKDMDDLDEVVSFTVNYWENSYNTFDFSNLVTIDFLDNGYTILNKLDQLEYTIKLKNGVQSLRNKYTPMADIDFQLLDTDKSQIGVFVYEGIESLYGKYKDENFRLNWKAEYSCIEVFIEKEQLALINYFPGSKVLFLSKEMSREHLIALINLLFVYDYGVAIRERMFSVYN